MRRTRLLQRRDRTGFQPVSSERKTAQTCFRLIVALTISHPSAKIKAPVQKVDGRKICRNRIYRNSFSAESTLPYLFFSHPFSRWISIHEMFSSPPFGSWETLMHTSTKSPKRSHPKINFPGKADTKRGRFQIQSKKPNPGSKRHGIVPKEAGSIRRENLKKRGLG